MRNLAVAVCIGLASFGAATGATAQEITRVPFRFPTGIATATTVPAGFRLHYISGQLPTLEPTNPGNTYVQARSVIAKLVKELAALGLKPKDAVKGNVFLVADPKTGKIDFDGFAKAWQEIWPGTMKDVPARSLVMVSGLALPNALVEVEMVAASR